MLNHNLIEKISQKYIQEQVEEDRRKTYIYLYNYSDSIGTDSLYYEFVYADNDKDCYIKVFNNLETYYGPFIREFQDDEIIKKYIEKWGFKDINEDYEFIEDFTDDPETFIFEEEDTEYINELKYKFIIAMLRLLGYEFRIIGEEDKGFLLIANNSGKML